ncbi:MAG: hypothetical protein ACR2MN_13480 [Acidimicrobiales bacterium]
MSDRTDPNAPWNRFVTAGYTDAEGDETDYDLEPDAPEPDGPVVPTEPGPALRVVGASDAYDPGHHVRVGLDRLVRRRGDGSVASHGHPTQRLAVMLEAWFWPLRHGADVWVSPRRTYELPAGGILRPLGDGELVQRAQARYRAAWPHEPIPARVTVATSLGALGGGATRLSGPPWLRWGRSPDGALWWDAGRPDGRCVRVTAEGWTVERSGGCWFRRSELIGEMPLPVAGGSLDDLWRFVLVDPEDRCLIVAWMLTATQPEPGRSPGLLYLTGPAGSAKSCAADFIARAAGSGADRKTIGTDDKDFMVAASAGWVLHLDNLSMLTTQQSDLLCTLVTGRSETYRTLYTTTDTTTLDVARPVIATSIDIPVLQPDLISRMVPASLTMLETVVPEDTIKARFAAVQPAIFGALLDLLAATMAMDTPPGVELPRLAVLGRTAAKADAIRGSDTLGRLGFAQSLLLADTINDDVFFAVLRSKLKRHWEGQGGELLALLDPNGDLARHHGRAWPRTSTGVTARLKRNKVPLEQAGWTIRHKLNPRGANKGKLWELVPPPDHPSAPDS